MAMTCDRVRALASGFVLGALDADEMIAISDHLDSCRKPHPEVGDLGGVLPYLAESLEPVEPPAWLRESVMAAAKADLAARRRASTQSEPRVAEPVAEPAVAPAILAAHGDRPPSLAGVISLAAVRASRARRAYTWAMRAAAVLAIVALSGYSLNLQGELRKAQQHGDVQSSILNAIQQGARSAVLTSADGSKAGGLAALMPTGHVLVDMHGLTATKGDQVYVVWLSSGTSGPIGTWIKAGSFTVDDSGVGSLTVDNVPASAILWIYVCREANSNMTQPTGPRVLSGTIFL
jgi:hypothetical protein